MIDNYISTKYKKNVESASNKTLDEYLAEANYLENAILSEMLSSTLTDNLYNLEIETVNVLNKMKETIVTIIDTLKKERNGFLKIMEDEEKLIKNTEVAYCDKEKLTQMEKEIKRKIKDMNKINIFEYKIKLLDQQIIKVKDENNKKNNEKNKKKKKEENKENKGKYGLHENPNEIALTEEDIFEIISTLYKYDFKMISKKEYDLNIEREKLEVKRLTAKLLTNEKDIKRELINDKEVKSLNDLMKSGNNLRKFCYLLNNYRVLGHFKIDEIAFDIIKNIFIICHEYLLKNEDFELVVSIIILPETFYTIKNGGKRFLSEEIKELDLFKKLDFWEKFLNNKIKSEIDQYYIDQKLKNDELTTKKNEENFIKTTALTQLIACITNMKTYFNSKEHILMLINTSVSYYNFSEDEKNVILSFLADNKK